MRPDLQLTAGIDGETYETPLVVHRHGIEIYWDGFVYSDTSRAQLPTVENLAEELRRNADLKESILALRVSMPRFSGRFSYAASLMLSLNSLS
jgi:hypothetical protein